MVADTKDSQSRENELAYDLLLALLESQFCSPVQWIKTQDSLLDELNVTRLLEIGPSDTLTSMMKKTLAQRESQPVDRECVTLQEELDWLDWSPQVAEEEEIQPEGPAGTDAEDAAAISLPTDKPTEIPKLEPVLRETTPLDRPQAVAEFEDAPLTAQDALTTIIAAGLKVGRATMDPTQSIKLLSKGRSAVQNEIVGNLASEFGLLPDGIEDTAIQEVAQELQPAFSGRLGQFLTGWLGKQLSAKLAPSISLSRLRLHLQSRHGLKDGRQSSCLVKFPFDDIFSRLNESDSWAKIDAFATSYMRDHGLNAPCDITNTQQVTQKQTQAVADPAAIKHFEQFGQDLASLVSKHFGPTSKPTEPVVAQETSDNTAPSTYGPQICTQTPVGGWQTDLNLTAELHRAGVNTSETQHSVGTVMIVGAGQRSIGFVLVEQLLAAGRRVVLTTSWITRSLRKVYSDMYAKYAEPGAELVLLPFNQGSVQDISNVIDYVHVDLGWEIDHLVPFAALSEIGRTVETIDSTSELAHRIMLTNTLRLIGAVISSKRQRGILHHCTQVLLPLSPNHGQLGGDGMYAESKLALEALMNKWHAEGWSDSVSICSVRIGWTRGTGLMTANDILAEGMEKLGVRTFSAKEMAILLTLAMSSKLYEAASEQPLLCDFSGDMMSVPNLRETMHGIRDSIDAAVSLKRRLQLEAKQETPAPRLTPAQDSITGLTAREPRAKLRREIPTIPKHHHEAVADVGYSLQGLIDLDSTVVITGFAELGAAGSSRTRWELESTGAFSLEGCIELAWMTGLIKYERNRMHEGKASGAGWIDANTGAPIKDTEIKEKYEEHIVQHTGIRILDPDPWQSSTDPRLKDMLQEVGTQGNLPPFECTSQAAQDLKTRHGSALEIISDNGDMATVRVLDGATIFVPKSLGTDFFVGAQVPTGWDAAKYGIPPEVIAQVTRPVLFSLVCVAEAFLCSGVEDVYDFYRYIHVSEVGNCIGSGSGGIASLHAVFERRFLGKDVQNDVLSESFVNIVAAWVNLLLLSAAGPLRSPAGTCATSLESLDTACDLIGLGKVKMCLTGGFDSATRPIFHEFAEMGATINSARDIEGGREPSEMSRPFTETRNGFVLGDGCGVQVVTSASLALQMGLPIHGVVAMTHMAADKLGRSVPAPGRGILTSAKQSSYGPSPAMLNPILRAKRIKTSLQHIERQAETDVAFLRDEDDHKAARQEPTSTEALEAEIQLIRETAEREKKAVLRELGNNFWKNDPRISPIVGSLSVFGLTVDELTFTSLHGTSTKLNDINECRTLDRQMCHLGRRSGNPLFTIAQKSVCGHGLGASGAWAVNGGLQAMNSGIIPGNRNADDIDAKLSQYDKLLLTNTNIRLPQSQMKAFSVTSFGFGQKGGQVIIVHPRYLFAAVSADEYGEYQEKQWRRAQVATRALDRGLHGEGIFKAKDHTPYWEQEEEALLNPLWRMS